MQEAEALLRYKVCVFLSSHPHGRKLLPVVLRWRRNTGGGETKGDVRDCETTLHRTEVGFGVFPRDLAEDCLRVESRLLSLGVGVGSGRWVAESIVGVVRRGIDAPHEVVSGRVPCFLDSLISSGLSFGFMA